MARERRQKTDWDPVRIVSQIIGLQVVHYIVLCLLTPLLFFFFSNEHSLRHGESFFNLSIFMDWREMAGKQTMHEVPGAQHHPFEHSSNNTSSDTHSGSGNTTFVDDNILPGLDPMRSWIVAAMWLLASCSDVYFIYILVRRPKLVLDFTLTLVLSHVILTTYYSAALPASLFFWFIMALGAAITTTLAEQMCVKRELREGIPVISSQGNNSQEEEMELGNLRPD